MEIGEMGIEDYPLERSEQHRAIKIHKGLRVKLYRIYFICT